MAKWPAAPAAVEGADKMDGSDKEEGELEVAENKRRAAGAKARGTVDQPAEEEEEENKEEEEEEEDEEEEEEGEDGAEVEAEVDEWGQSGKEGDAT